MTDDFHYSGPKKDDDSNSNNNSNNNGPPENLIFLKQSEKLKQENIVTKFVVKTSNGKRGTSGFIELELNHKYEKKKVITDICDSDWIKTIKLFTNRAREKGVEDQHITMLCDVLDDSAARIIDIFGVIKNNETSSNILRDQKEQVVAAALDFVEKQTIKIFLNQVNTPYIAIKVKNHTEVMPLVSQMFEDWLAATFYNHQKQITKDEAKKHENGYSYSNTVKILSPDDIKKVQTILRFEANNSGEIITLNSRIAAFIDEQDPNNNEIYYDLCNKDWEIIKITCNGWSLERNYPKILFKRHAINKAQVLPNKDYPKDKNHLEDFMRLTNVYDDYGNRMIAKVYLVSLFLLTDLPKPIMMPHGTHGSGKSTFQELNKQVVDPSAAPTTAFPSSLAELTQMLDHSYLTIFDNVSEISAVTSDTLCRVVTGNGLVKRALYTNDEDFIYNMTRAVGFNGINVTATRADLLDRLLNLHLYPIDKRQRKRLKVLHQEFEAMLPNLLGYIFDILVQVLSRIGEVKLQELPRMADFAEMGELIARCLGYKPDEFTDAYNCNIGFTNQEAIDSSPVATAIIALMDVQPFWTGRAEKLRVELNKLIMDTEELKGLMYSKGWPKNPRSMRARLNEITPNLKEIGIVIHFEYNEHTKADDITLVNNNFTLGPGPSIIQESQFWEVFDELVIEEAGDQNNHMSDDKDTVGHDKLHSKLVAFGFLSEDATQTINKMIEYGKLKIVAVNTYRRAMFQL